MKYLTVLYDASCGFCVSCRRWLETQPPYVPLRFIPSRSTAATRLFPDLPGPEPNELVAVSDEGHVYTGASAWIMCLWALEAYREWALRLSVPALLPFARRAFELLSHNRKAVSRALGLLPEQELGETLRRAPDPSCSLSSPRPSSH
jgi:predicted DCC family thiol-disulfide oxidoreductase YuxK